MPSADFAYLLERTTPTPVHLLPFADIHRAFAGSAAMQGKGHLAAWLNDYFLSNHITPTLHGTATPLSFVAQDDLPHGTAYEAFIHQTGKIPTRDNLHDWFGACVWAKFPKSKAMLNAKHMVHFTKDTAHQSGNGRNRVRDTITVFDENGAVLVVCDDDIGTQIAQGLTQFDWQACLVASRQYWHNPDDGRQARARVFVFGHALLEQMLNPYKSLCSHALILRVPQAFFTQSDDEQLAMLDGILCAYLDGFLTAQVTPRQLSPLPILGVPHFWDNQDPKFYEDKFVFRDGRRAAKR